MLLTISKSQTHMNEISLEPGWKIGNKSLYKRRKSQKDMDFI